jgi:chemotaxis-related protein WspD
MGVPAPVTTNGSHTGINDCWNKIGVRGDGSCPELQQYSHCRNCPVFAAAALMLLDRDLPAGYKDAWMSHIAQKRSESKSSILHSAIILRLGAEWLAFPTLAVDEIVELPRIHSLPHRRSGTVLGLANVHGELVVCASLSRTLGLDETVAGEGDRTGTAAGRLVVVRSETGRIAFPVDEVQRTHRYDPSDLKSVPATLAKSAANYTKGILAWRDRVVGCLDDQLVLQAMNRAIG